MQNFEGRAEARYLVSNNDALWLALLRDVILPNSSAKRIQAVARIPDYVWHVIAVPRKEDAVAGEVAYMVRANAVLDYNKGQKLIPQTKIPGVAVMDDNVFLFHLHNSAKKIEDIDEETGELLERKILLYAKRLSDGQKARITSLWLGLLGREVWKTFVQDIQSPTGGNTGPNAFDIHFYFYSLKEVKAKITGISGPGPQTFKQASFRTPPRSGAAHGFILDPNGLWLAHRKITISDKDE